VPEIEPKTLRIAVAPTFGDLPVAAEMRAALESLARQLRPSGAIVEIAPLPELDWTEDLLRAGALISMMLGAVAPDADGAAATLAQYLTALHRRDQSNLAWERFFESWDVLLCPPAMMTAFPHGEPGSPLQVDGQPVTQQEFMQRAPRGPFVVDIGEEAAHAQQ
jgi:amidase